MYAACPLLPRKRQKKLTFKIGSFCLPSSVRGPVLSKALRRLASVCFCEVIAATTINQLVGRLVRRRFDFAIAARFSIRRRLATVYGLVA